MARARKHDWIDEVVDVLLESTEAELEALERNPPVPIKKKTRKRDTSKKPGAPRDELGRFTKPAKKR